MRPYRGKRTDNGVWVYGWYYHFLPDYHFIIQEAINKKIHAVIKTSADDMPLEFIPVDPKTVVQFTGLLDKQGEEIYAGDIVAWWYSRIKKICFTDVVLWSNEKAGWILKEHPMHRIDLFTPEKNLEVIGNFHENPELLEVKK